MKKKLIGILLVIVTAFAVIPFTSYATDPECVYISISFDGQFVNDQYQNPIAYVPVPISDLQAIDLIQYGLEDFCFDGDGDGNEDITALHLYIYTHENLFGLDWNDVVVTGSSGSIFFEQGLFGFEDCNLNYYLNGSYPEAYSGWGATADILSLKAGDFYDIAAYTSWAFWSDSATGFNYFANENDEITHAYTANAGEEVPVKLIRSGGGFGGILTINTVPDCTLFYGTTLGDIMDSVTTDSDGCAVIPALAAGDWYVWCDGGYGLESPQDIVSSPAYAKLTVVQTEQNNPVKEAIKGTALTVGTTKSGNTVIIAPTAKDNSAMTLEEFAETLKNPSVTISANNGVIATGSKVTIGEYTVDIVVKGDIDGDGIATVFDALMIKKTLAGNGFENEELREYAGDADKSGTTDNSDVAALLSHIVGNGYIE